MRKVKIIIGAMLLMFPTVFSVIILHIPTETGVALLKGMVFIAYWFICKAGAKMFIDAWNSK